MDLPTVGTLDRPADDDALRHRARGMGPADALLGGGTWLFSTPQTHLRALVDLTGPGWPALTVTDDGLTVAATATLAELAAFRAAPDWAAAPLLRGCCDALVGSAKIQHVATVGGNVALALPAAPMVTLAAALDGVAVVWPAAGGTTRVAVADLVVGAQRSALGPGDVLRAVELPVAALRARTALRKASPSPLGRSAALLAGRVDADGTFVLALTAALERPAVLRFAAVPDAATLRDAVDVGRSWYDDPHGSPAWRRAMTVRLAEEIRGELAWASR